MHAVLLALALLAQDKVVTLSGHTGDVSNVQFSPDGRTLASSGGDRTIRLWDVASGKELAAISGLKMTPSRAAFSHDGKIVAAGQHRTIHLWEAPSGKPVRTMERDAIVFQIAFGTDGKTLLSANMSGTIEVYDCAEGKHLRSLETGAFSVALSADATTIATAEFQKLKFWDPATGSELRKFDVQTGGIALSPDGKTVAIGGMMGARLLDAATGKETGALKGGAGRLLSSPFFSGDGKTLCTPLTGKEGVVLWDAASLKERRTIETPGRKMAHGAVSPDGRAYAWPSGKDVKVWTE